MKRTATFLRSKSGFPGIERRCAERHSGHPGEPGASHRVRRHCDGAYHIDRSPAQITTRTAALLAGLLKRQIRARLIGR